MSKSYRDKDFHKLRNSEKYFGKWIRDALASRYENGMTTEYSEREKEYDRVWSKYGFKSMVSNKRRRNNTRKSNQKDAVVERRIERAKNKREFQKLLKDGISKD